MPVLKTSRLICRPLNIEDWAFFLTLQQNADVMRFVADENNECAEVGFLLTPEAQDKGYGTESLHAVCDYAFTHGGLRRLTACVTAGNEASRRLLEKIGFIHEGTLRESYWLQQTWRDDWLFGLLKREYQPPMP